MPRYLTKSRFKLALTCPTKLFYTGKEIYPDATSDDSFLDAISEGGYQVGTLAKCYYPEGIEVQGLGYDESLQVTNELLNNQQVTIFEGAFKYKNLFIRADIIEKKGNRINLVEVKAKSFEGKDSLDFLKKDGYLIPKWRDYLYDVAFQKYVISNAFPDLEVHAYLMLVNKNAMASVDGLNHKFLLRSVDGERTTVEIVGDVSVDALGREILIRVDVDNIMDMIFEGTDTMNAVMPFAERVHYYADKYELDEKIISPINKDCKICEFKATPEQLQDGKLSGYRECWTWQLGWNDEMFNHPTILDIWDYRRKNDLMDENKFLMQDLTEEDIGTIKPQEDGSLSRVERQWLQVRKAVDNENQPYVDVDGLKAELDKFKFPLHFIDFETSMVAIPFFNGRRPYEQIAFQFSHHIVHDDLTIEHKGQYLCEERGKFPNYDFIRALKLDLESDGGSIFRYASHENTVLNQILKQLQDADIPDRQDLIDFIQSISHSANHRGDRDMIDLLDLVRKYYYHPLMGGSNSLKYVLPAVLNSSEYIQEKYSRPIYGKNSQMKSMNFEDGWVWVERTDNGSVVNPYKLLPPLLEGIDDEQIENFFIRNDIQDGGAAMTAYAKMQFTQISETEKDLLVKGLLRYCELDTLAMVMIWEYWNDLTK